MPFMINILSTILPPATRRNAAIITIYSAVIGALFLITNVLFKTKADANVLDLTAYTPTSTPAMIIMVILMVWIFFAGLALLAVYGIFIFEFLSAVYFMAGDVFVAGILFQNIRLDFRAGH